MRLANADSIQLKGVCGILRKLHLESQELLPISVFVESYELSEAGSTSVFYIDALQVSPLPPPFCLESLTKEATGANQK